jgi:hypothetical protein
MNPTTNPQPAPATRKVTAVLGWFPTTPATEREILDMANSRQVALRTRLRHHYWLTECRPISDQTITNMRRKMAMIDPQDAMPDDQVAELLSPHYGFAEAADASGAFVGWTITDLDEALQAATASITATRERMSQLGKASAARRTGAAVGRSMAGPQAQARVQEFVDQQTGEVVAAVEDEDF